MSNGDSILDKIITQQRDTDLASFNPLEVKKELFSHLKSREEDVLTKRFGLNGTKKMTLEEIGKSYHVTRERIRQIEIFAIKKLLQVIKKDDHLASSHQAVRHILQQSGGIKEQEDLLNELVEYVKKDTSQALSDTDKQALKNFFVFATNHLWSEMFEKINDSDDYHIGWRLSGTSLSALNELVDMVVQIINEKKDPVKSKKLVKILTGKEKWNEYSSKNVGQIPSEIERIIDQLRVSKKIGENKFNEWGMATATMIHPKRMTDKIFLVLKHHGKPLHFRDITNLINETNFDYKKAYPPTIHNELILDKRYVLIGRGIYALAEWGYFPGTVADVITRIITENKEPSQKEEIIKKVKKQRQVNQTTINLALTNKKKFTKEKGGYYSLNRE